ncbi:nucleoid-associated protein YgaU, partial [Streptacidiphilus sp. MAP12-33]|uniref:LysM peptidoglycan-binding domain-containing protein n=1 Tax=Streptacidiphilus sp. MAP12-33 TaxID=3156266 RepID=UPI003517B05E
MVRTFLRAFGAFVTLLALLVGLPGVLGYGTWAIAVHARPEQSSLTQLLTRPDNGNLFLWALVAVGWIAWLALAVSVLVEIPAQLRGRVARRLPTLGWSQRLAGGLVGAILALLPMAGGALAATGAPAPRLAVTAPHIPESATAGAGVTAPDAAPVRASAHARLPHYTVRATRPAETLWGIAQQTLGSGERWREIAKLNEGRVMDAHHRVFDAERPIQPGWELLLPPEAHVPHGTGAAAGHGGASGEAVASTARHAHAGSAARDDDSAAPGGHGTHRAPAAHGAVHTATTASAAHTAPSGGVSHEGGRVVTVRHGDTLSAIAEREMGSAAAWPRLFAANRGALAPDGRRLTDPNLIEPGMRLTIPAAAPGTDGGSRGGGVPASGGSGAGAGAGGSGTPTAAPTPGSSAFTQGGSSTPPASGAPSSTPAPTRVPGQTSGQTPVPDSVGSGAAHGGHQSAGQFAVAAGTSVLGAVLVGTVALRRSRRRTVPPRQAPQHRASGRPPKPPTPAPTRAGSGLPPLEPAAVPLPPVPAPLASPLPPAPGPYVPTLATPQAVPELLGVTPAEQQSARDLDLLGRALRSMARNVAREGRRLPPINVVRVTASHTVELHLVAPAPPVAPFRAAHASTVWWCTPDAPGLLGPEAAAVVPSPYPALVSLGETIDGATVLVDLEAIRLLHVSGEPHDIARVLRTLALELTFTPLADRVGVHVVGIAQELAAVADDRLVVHPGLEQAVAALQRRDAAVRSALVQAGAATPREARSRGLGGDEWAPEVVLCASYPTGDVPEALGRLLDARPRGSVAVITAAPPQGSGPVARWTLPADGHGVVPGLEMEIQLQKLDDDTYHHWLRLLGADLQPPVPAPAAAPAPSWPPTGPLADPATNPLDAPAVSASRFPEAGTPATTSSFPVPGTPVSGRFPTPGGVGATQQGLRVVGSATPPPASDASLAGRFPTPRGPVPPPLPAPTPAPVPRVDPRFGASAGGQFPAEPGVPQVDPRFGV